MLLAYLGYVSGAEHGEKAIWFVMGFPVATYFIFGFYGGGTIMAENREYKKEETLANHSSSPANGAG